MTLVRRPTRYHRAVPKRSPRRAARPAEPDSGRAQRGATYAASGVDIEAGDRFASAIVSLMRRTHGPRVLARPGGFAGLLRLDYNEEIFKHNYKDPVLVACCDGVGTKIKLAVDAAKLARDRGDHDAAHAVWRGIGVDLVAMSVNDLVVEGAEPLLFLDYIACHAIDHGTLHAIVEGVADACRASGAALLGGETAEMSDLYAEDDLDLAGFALGVVELGRATDSARVEPGDVVLGLESDGLHSNGFTLVRSIVREAGLDLAAPYDDLDPGRPLADALLTPTRLYAAPIVRLLRAYRVKKVVTGMAHITGGGLAGNLARALHPGVDAVVHRPGSKRGGPVPPVFGFLQKHGGVETDEMHRVFNMGLGYALIVRPSFADSITARLSRAGERVHRIGEVRAGKGRVIVR